MEAAFLVDLVLPVAYVPVFDCWLDKRDADLTSYSKTEPKAILEPLIETGLSQAPQQKRL